MSQPIAEALARRRARRDPDSPLVFHRDGIPIRRWRTAWRTACQAAGVPTRFLHDCRRTAARNLIRASVPERVAMLLTGHKTRAIFDRYNIINEQELLEAGDQLVAYLAQHAQATPRGGRPHPGPHRRPAHRAAPPPRATHHRLRAAPRGGTPDGVRRGHPRGRPGDVAGNRAVSRSTRFTTAGAPDRRDLPGGEGHVRRCGPGKRGAKHPLIRRPMQRPRGDAVTGRLAGRAWAARDVAGGRARGAGAGPAVRASGGAEARGTDVVPARPWPDGGEGAASGAPPNWSSVIAVDAPGERGIRCVPWTRTASVAPGGQAPRNGASILDSARGLGIRDAHLLPANRRPSGWHTRARHRGCAAAPHGWVRPHTDIGAYYRVRDRFHLVLRSRNGSPLTSAGETVVMREGELWAFDNKAEHEARNLTAEPRVHLIFDVLPAPGRGYYVSPHL